MHPRKTQTTTTRVYVVVHWCTGLCECVVIVCVCVCVCTRYTHTVQCTSTAGGNKPVCTPSIVSSLSIWQTAVMMHACHDIFAFWLIANNQAHAKIGRLQPIAIVAIA